MDFAPIWVNLKPGATETEIMPKHFGRKPYGCNSGRYYGRKAYGRTLTIQCRIMFSVRAHRGGRVHDGLPVPHVRPPGLRNRSLQLRQQARLRVVSVQ